MAIDATSQCPGGTGKKIKFCCPDFISELDKIDRMLDGEQYLACRQHIDRLEEQGEHRACLMATKSLLLRGGNELEAAQAYAAEFLRRFPENPIAWAESAILAALFEGGQSAIPKVQRAIECNGTAISSRVYETLGAVADVLLHEGQWAASRALLRFQTILAPKDSAAMEKFILLCRSPEIPLLMKSDPPPFPNSPDVRWQARLDEALAPTQRGRWQEAAEKLAALAVDVPRAPAVWHHLAILRGWLADDDGAIEAWRKFAALEVPLEDAVEAEALAMMLSQDPLGDALDWLRLTWPLHDFERMHESLLSDRRVVQVPFDPASLSGEDSPPPRLVALLLDRPQLESAEGLSLETVPRMLGQVLLFGRQTDRPARLEIVGLTSQEVPGVEALLRELGGAALTSEPDRYVAAQSSASHELLAMRTHPPRGASREQVEALAVQHQRQAMLEQWTEMPLGVLGGKSPREAAADPDSRIRVLAAILVLDHWTERSSRAVDPNELRTRLGLPVLQPIELSPRAIEDVSLVRLARVNVEKLSDEDLLLGFNRATFFRAREAMRKFARAVVQRSTLADRPERFQAYSSLAQSAETFEEALKYIAEGRRAGEAAGRSCASWDLLELSIRLSRGDGREVMPLMQHIQARHMQEPGVAETLTQMLIDVGLLNPDGTPARPADAREAAAAAVEPGAAEPSRLWTPGGESPGGGGGKLWTPGS